MLVVLNGYPGVGKLTIGRELISLIDGRLLDNHSVYNVAFALTEFRSAAFYDTVRAVQAVADERISALPRDVPIVLTEVLTEGSDWGDECWRRIEKLGKARAPLCVVHLMCDLDENKRRIQSEERALKRTLRDPSVAERNHEQGAVLMGAEARNSLEIDVTDLSASEAASRIAKWLRNVD